MESTIAIVKTAYDGDATKMSLAREIGTACGDVTGADRCEAAHKIFECVKIMMVVKGLTADDM